MSCVPAATQLNRVFLGVLLSVAETGLGQEMAKPQSMRGDRRAMLAVGAGNGRGRHEMIAVPSSPDAAFVTCIAPGRLRIFAGAQDQTTAFFYRNGTELLLGMSLGSADCRQAQERQGDDPQGSGFEHHFPPPHDKLRYGKRSSLIDDFAHGSH
jgi:hypothetical protein